ncbi:MAG TPA: amidase family protein, partial [Longimicrobiales bacterium]|nr:amidase family protein [Longimicrobiales bacterium]
TIAGVHEALDDGRLTCRTLVQGYLDRIRAYDDSGPELNAVQQINPRALARADSLDRQREEAGREGSLHCVPVLLKDQVETRDMPTTYGSAIFEGFVSGRDATIVRRLEGAGAIILAKTTMGEFAQRYVGSAYGIIRNAYDPTRNPSGSSGGTASGVAANFGLVGIGEDTGGSVRGPAAVSNLVGLRPSLPLVSRYGMMPANPSQDTMGPMTRTVDDAARVLAVIAGYDPEDPITAWSVGHVPESYRAGLRPDALQGVRIGVWPRRTEVPEGFEAEFAQARALFDRALDDLRALGAEVVEPVTLDLPDEGLLGNVWETEEATDAYLAGLEDPPVRSLRQILLSGTVIPWRQASLLAYLGHTTRDPGYLAFTQARQALRVEVLRAMADAELDALVHLTFDAPPMPIAEDVLTNPAPNDQYGLGDNRGWSPATGFPALTVPAGFTPEGLPVGLEFLGRPFTEALLLEMGYAYEQGTGHRRPAPTAPALDGGR